MIEFSAIIKKLMEYYGLKQEELASKFNVEASQISRWLNNKSVPRGEEYMRFYEEYIEIKDKKPPLFELLGG